MSIAEKLITVAENVPKVYKAGQKSMVDESKIIEKTVSGSVIAIDDVSEVPHEVAVQLSSDTVTGFSGVAVKVFGQNIFSNVVTSSVANPLTKINSTTYSIAPDMNNGKMYGIRADVSTLPLEIGDVLKCSVKSISKIGATYGWRVEYQDGTYNGASNSLNATLTVNKPFKALLLYCDMGAAGFSFDSVVFTDVVVYKESDVTRYTANSDGRVDVKSISPYMTISTDTADVNITSTYHKSWGMQTEYDRFWDAYQANGTRTNYQRCFSGLAWTAETLKPKYDISPTFGGGAAIFQSCGFVGSLKKHFETLGIKLDFSKLTGLAQPFYQAVYITEMPDIDISGCVNNCTYLFYGCTALKSAKIKTSEAVNIATNSFTNCTALEELRFEGVIANNLDLHWSTKLSFTSLVSIVGALSKTVSGQSITLPTTARQTYDDATVSGRWDELVAEYPNWSFKYS